MKVYIVGSVASGKTTFARLLSNKCNIPCTHLDGIIHIKDKTEKKWGNIRRTDDEINRMFKDIVSGSEWIIEDAGRKCFSEGMEKADIIFHLKPSVLIRRKRIITRYLRQKTGMEESIYTPSIRMLKFMFKALSNYESGKDDLDSRLNQYNQKVIVLKTKYEINEFMASIGENS